MKADRTLEEIRRSIDSYNQAFLLQPPFFGLLVDMQVSNQRQNGNK